MVELIKIGKQIALLRKEKGFTGEKLAEILDVSPQAVSKWENGKCLPEAALLPALAKTLDCSIDTLLMPRDEIFKLEDNERVKEFYDKMNEDVRLETQTKEFARSKDIISRYLFHDNMEIADIGGGTGPYSFWLAEKGHKIHLLDLSPKHIDIAKHKSKANNINLASYTCADARELPYENESMDMEHIPPLRYRYLRKNT
ncbi:MAG: helix-turn-helix domain-containing protein [Defluviitaleaceae bacterium]|nr:helix-turn-helix domain-containing protein [Defluviitaleaceae bacterium]